MTLTITILPATSGQSSGQAGGRAVNTEVLDEGFVPEAGMEELDAPLNEFL